MNINKKPNEVYYDITIKNTQLSGSELQPLRFSEMRNSPIIEGAGDYSMSIVRFCLDTYSLPSFIADIEQFPNTNVNKMIDTVSLEYTSTTVGPQNLTWVPTNEHISMPLPLSASSPKQEDSEYYYGNSFRHYCDLVNTALATLTTQLKTAVGVTLNNLLPPMMIWNNENQTASIVAQEEFYNWSRTNHVKIYFNRSLYAKFTSLPAVKNYNNVSSKIYKIYMKSDYSTKLVQLDPISAGSQVFIKTDQEYSTISNWSPVANICFTSPNLPIVATQISEPINYNNKTNSQPKVSEPIITDMATGEMVYKPSLIYVPSAQYRFIDLFGNNNINNIDINVFWRDKDGQLHPFYLQSGGSCTIKILFKLKD